MGVEGAQNSFPLLRATGGAVVNIMGRLGVDVRNVFTVNTVVFSLGVFQRVRK